MELSNDEIRRYSRHLILPEVGMAGQKKLKGTSVLCIGTGGLGSPISMYLAAAGIGRIGLVDFDVVDFSNLQRQIAHGTEDVGRPKVESATETINSINPNVVVDKHEAPLTSENAMALVADYDIVVDGTDNFPTRYLTNDACVLQGKPNVYGSIFRSTDRRACSHPAWTARAIVVFTRNHRHPAWCQAVQRAACSVCCPASSAAFRPRRLSNSRWAKVHRSSGVCSSSMRWK